jgi:hypothetical protein
MVIRDSHKPTVDSNINGLEVCYQSEMLYNSRYESA